MNTIDRDIDASTATKNTSTTPAQKPLTLRRDVVRVVRVKSGLKTGSSITTGTGTEKQLSHP